MEIRGKEINGPWSAVANPDDFRAENDLSGLVGIFSEGTEVQIVVPFTSAEGPTVIE
jgi:hypothetical protein